MLRLVVVFYYYSKTLGEFHHFDSVWGLLGDFCWTRVEGLHIGYVTGVGSHFALLFVELRACLAARTAIVIETAKASP